ncbi:MAG TPA: hypothetical protein VGO62_11560, partial [Myxococcota bacterium]
VTFTAPVNDSVRASIALVDDSGARVAVDVVATLGGRGARVTPKDGLVAGTAYTLVVPEGSAASGPVSSVDFGAASSSTEDPLHQPVALALLAASAAGFDRVAVASRFVATDLPRVDLDVAARRGPYPSDFFVDGSGRTLLPPGPLSGANAMLDDAALANAAAAAASVPGFSTSGRAQLPLVAGRADGSAGFAILGPHGVVNEVTPSLAADGATVFLKPNTALTPGTDYALVVDGSARSGGAPVLPSLDAALLVGTGALGDGSGSSTALLDDDSARLLERARERVAPLLDRIPRAGVALAVPFTTLDAFAYVDGIARTVETRVDPALVDASSSSPLARGLVLPHVDTVITGHYASLDSIDPVTLRASTPQASAVPFLATVPAGAGPFPVVLFGHGLLTEKELAYLIADQLADAGFAMFAIDLPMHGERSVCLVDAHCDLLQSCGDDHQCHTSDGGPGSLVTAASPFPGGPAVPVATGEAFVLVSDLVASRDHFAQGYADLRQGIRVLGAGLVDDRLARDHFDWLGISLGGITGAAMAGTTSAIDKLALNVPGADLVVTLEDSTVLSPLLEQQLSARGVSKGDPAYAAFEDAAHLVLDPVDPLNLAARATSQVPSGWRAKPLLLQMANTDLVV